MSIPVCLANVSPTRLGLAALRLPLTPSRIAALLGESRWNANAAGAVSRIRIVRASRGPPMMNFHRRPDPLVLCILDGWGVRREGEDNAIAEAKTPV